MNPAVMESTENKVDKSENRVREMFGAISHRYDFLNHFLSGGVDYLWRRHTIKKYPPIDDSPILDVCSGTGDLAIAYWNKATGKNQVIGADFTHEMLKIANEKRDKKIPTKNELKTLSFLEADTQKLPFQSDAFQIVSVAFGLRNVTDTEKGLKEMIRVCKPGGRVVILEFSLPGNRILRGGYTWYFKNVLPRIGQLLARNKQSAYNYLPDSVSEFPYGKALGDIMENCGLINVEWQPLTFGIATLYCGKKPNESSGSSI